MKEVLSDSRTFASDERQSDERQSLRIARFLMGAGTSLLVCLALAVFAFLGLLPWRVAAEGTGGIVLLVLVFYALFYSGFNLRFSDPSLTTEQIACALLFLTYLMYHAPTARGALSLFYLVAMLFGVLRLNARRLMVLALLALCAFGVMLQLWHLHNPEAGARAGLTHFVALAIVLPWFAAMGGYVNRLRTRLSDSHRELKVAFDRIEQLAIRDELTGAYNRRFLMEVLRREISRAERLRTPFSVCLLDVDHFKRVNDTRGHAEGDAVLKEVAGVAARGRRAVDTFGRFGGEEFLLVLPGTELAGARVAAERLRAAVQASPARVTVTIGIAEYASGEDLAALLGRADRALYAGKDAGRNLVIG